MIEQVSINETLVLIQAVRSRLGSLKSLRESVAVKRTFFGNDKEVREPTYDVKELDKKIVELEMFLFKSSAKIKQSNAVTLIETDWDVNTLLEPLK